jgi:hypothetical protein
MPLGVQVFERLVQQQYITAPQHQQRELQAAALTERAGSDWPEDTVATEQEEVQEMAPFGLTHGALLADSLQNLLGLQHICPGSGNDLANATLTQIAEGLR